MNTLLPQQLKQHDIPRWVIKDLKALRLAVSHLAELEASVSGRIGDWFDLDHWGVTPNNALVTRPYYTPDFALGIAKKVHLLTGWHFTVSSTSNYHKSATELVFWPISSTLAGFEGKHKQSTFDWLVSSIPKVPPSRWQTDNDEARAHIFGIAFPDEALVGYWPTLKPKLKHYQHLVLLESFIEKRIQQLGQDLTSDVSRALEGLVKCCKS